MSCCRSRRFRGDKILNDHLIDAIIKQVVEIIPIRDDMALRSFIAKLPPISVGAPDPNDDKDKRYVVGDWFFTFRRYHEPNLKQNWLEFWPGTAGTYWGYLRLNPYFYDDEGRNRKIWELTHAFAYTKIRGLGINKLYVKLTMKLATLNKADLLVANPRHVSMLVTLTDQKWRVRGTGGSQVTIKRIIKQGREWYGNNPSSRRMYYAEELRSFMTDGSLMMEKTFAMDRFLGR